MQHLIYINYSIEQDSNESYLNLLSMLPNRNQFVVVVEPFSRTEEGLETPFIKHLKYIISKRRITILLLSSVLHLSTSRTQIREFLMHCKRSEVKVLSFKESWLEKAMLEKNYSVFLREITKQLNNQDYLNGALPQRPRTRKGIFIS